VTDAPAGASGPSDPWHDQRPLRLNRFLANAGVASRRAVERWIVAGRVTVNGEVVTHPGQQIVRLRDVVCVDGMPVDIVAEPCHVLLYKPVGVLSTTADPQGRPTVLQVLGDAAGGRRLYPIGRLDHDSEGLLLLTDDGALTHRLLHPRYHVAKRYRVWTVPAAAAAQLEHLARGVTLDDGERTRPADVEPAAAGSFAIVLREGRKRQIRRMCRAVGLHVVRLVRTHFGPLSLGRMRPGGHRLLDAGEVAALCEAAGLSRHRRF